MSTATMHAIGSYQGLPIDDPESLQDVEIPVPELRPRDVLVRVQAVSVNPVDIKVRAGLAPSTQPRILGFDAAGVIEAVGPQVSTLAVGDEVWYAGDITRPGANAELHAVDERIVARKPVTLDFAQAAAMPLTTITAWETLFDRFGLTADSTGTLLVLGGAGGVGSIMIQLAKELTAVRVLASAANRLENTGQPTIPASFAFPVSVMTPKGLPCAIGPGPRAAAAPGLKNNRRPL